MVLRKAILSIIKFDFTDYLQSNKESPHHPSLKETQFYFICIYLAHYYKFDLIYYIFLCPLCPLMSRVSKTRWWETVAWEIISCPAHMFAQLNYWIALLVNHLVSLFTLKQLLVCDNQGSLWELQDVLLAYHQKRVRAKSCLKEIHTG